MKKGWKIERLGDVCELDKIPHRKNNLPYVGLEHIESSSGKFIGSLEPLKVKSQTFNFSDKHVLYGRLRPYLKKVLLPDFEGHCSTEIFPLKVSDRLDRKFLFHWLLSDEITNKINATSTGARMPRANMNQVLDFEIPIPPLPEQQRIVALLDETFAALTKVHANAERNQVNAREVFDSELNVIFENTGNGWKERKIEDVCEVGDGNYSSKYPRADEFLPNGIPFLTASNLKKGTIASEGIRFISPKLHSTLKKGHVVTGDLIIVVRGSSTGNVSILPEEFSGSNLNSQLAFLRTNKSDIDSNYLYFVFASPIIQRKIKNTISGSAQPQLPINKLVPITIPVPPLAEQRAIVGRLEALSAETGRLEEIYQQKVESLEELKRSVLGKAFSGEL